jgi:putative FmdB family regulatory protein
MPVYEYLCEKCGHEFEREQRITEDPIKTCPACRGRRVKKLISQTSFVLKGGGWYSDLYSSSSDKKGDKASDATDSKESSKKDSGTKSSSGDSDSSDSSKTSKKTKDKKPSKSKGSST